VTSTPEDEPGLNDSLTFWTAVSPLPTEIAAGFAAFDGARVVYILPVLMVRRALLHRRPAQPSAVTAG
jgi:hypothetical protein